MCRQVRHFERQYEELGKVRAQEGGKFTGKGFEPEISRYSCHPIPVPVAK